MLDAITFDAQQKLFILRGNRSYYAMRLLDDGALVHVGFGPAQTVPDAFSGLDSYEEPNYVWENQGRRWEYPTFGDVSQHDVALTAAFPEPPGERRGVSKIIYRSAMCVYATSIMTSVVLPSRV